LLKNLILLLKSQIPLKQKYLKKRKIQKKQENPPLKKKRKRVMIKNLKKKEEIQDLQECLIKK